MTELTSQGPLVLITGLTGFVAQRVLLAVLAAPQQYRVRGTVRSLSKSSPLISSALANSENPAWEKRVELVEVADTATSDLTEALKDADFVLHTASPYFVANVTDPKKQLLDPAVQGTLNVLKYAKDSKTIKRIVITSSFAAITDFGKGGPNRPGFTYTAEDWQPAGEKEAVETGGALAYSVSKRLAEEAAWNFVKEHQGQLNWDVVAINPPMIYGKSVPWVTKKTLNTSSAAIYNLIASLPQLPDDRLPIFCHVDDVAAAHARALAIPAAGGKRILLQGGAFNWALGAQHIAKKYPKLRERLPKGFEDAENKGEDKYAKLDTSFAEKELGIKFKGYQETLDDCINDLLELEKKPDWDA